MKNIWQQNKKIIIVLGLITFLIGLFLFNFYKKKLSLTLDNEIIISDNDMEKEDDDLAENINFYVEIKGAVEKPGVYEVKSGQIINDLVSLAGGFTATAYTDNINLSYELAKQMVIYIYTENEYKKSANKESVKIIEQACNCADYVIDECIDNKESVIKSDNQTTNSSSENKDNNGSANKPESENKPSLVNINTANKTQLMTLNGIGEAKAQKIIDYRNEHGLFQKIEDIKKVSGIGDVMYEKIKAYLTV